MLPRFAAKRDFNEAEIFLALRVAGCDPKRFTDFDIGAVHSGGWGVLLEVKTRTGKLREKQIWLQEVFKDRYCICRTVEDALRACGRMV
jgi:hypothetical protein